MLRPTCSLATAATAAAKRTLFPNHRGFRSTAACHAEAAPGTPAEADTPPTPKQIAKKRADAWLKEEGKEYRDAAAAHFVSRNKKTPFPMNPFFKPKSPLSDATRTDIFSKYLSDPSAWTPRALAEKFGLSIVRVQAILRLKALQQQMEKDKVPLQTGLTRGMEAMLGAETLSAADGQKKPRERLRATPAKRLQPFFRMMDEEEAFLPEDAAALMQLEPYANLQRKLDEAADHVFELEPRKGKKPEIISKDENLKSKFQYMIVDTSNVEKAQVVFRDKDGSLRHATVEERFKRKNQKAKFLM